MLRLYRGIIDILICKSETLTSAFTKHIREFNQGDDVESYGTTGFWNLLLEVTCLLYVKLFVGIGMLMAIVLAICFFPLYAMTRAFSGSFSMIRYENRQPIEYNEPKVEPVQEKK
jgi:uncharacterized membrane protein